MLIKNIWNYVQIDEVVIPLHVVDHNVIKECGNKFAKVGLEQSIDDLYECDRFIWKAKRRKLSSKHHKTACGHDM